MSAYAKPAIGTGIVVFLVGYLYAIAAYGFLLGGALGWIPAMIVAVITALLWPLVAVGAAVMGLIAVIGILQNLPYR